MTRFLALFAMLLLAGGVSGTTIAPVYQDGSLDCWTESPAEMPIDKLVITTNLAGIAQFTQQFSAFSNNATSNQSTRNEYARSIVGMGYTDYKSNEVQTIRGSGATTQATQFYENFEDGGQLAFQEDVYAESTSSRPFSGANDLSTKLTHSELTFGTAALGSKTSNTVDAGSSTPTKLDYILQVSGSSDKPESLTNGMSVLNTFTQYEDKNHTVSHYQFNTISGRHNLTGSFSTDNTHRTNFTANLTEDT